MRPHRADATESEAIAITRVHIPQRRKQCPRQQLGVAQLDGVQMTGRQRRQKIAQSFGKSRRIARDGLAERGELEYQGSGLYAAVSGTSISRVNPGREPVFPEMVARA